MENNYTVSVRLMTYMHASFIKDAMDSIMMQKTDFKVEVVVGDDFSTDGTLDIIRKYEDTANIHINILERKKGGTYWQKRQQLGRLYNFTNILENCSGKYIALLDGDDYWTDPLKLQKQVDFLEENKDYNLVTTYTTRFNQNKGEFHPPQKMKAYTFTYKDIIFNNCSPTCATIIKNRFDKDFTFKEGWGTDSQLWMRVLELDGKGYKFPETMAVYRKHDRGVSTIAHKNHKDYYDQKKYALRKIEKAKFWNSYFNNTANQSVKKVRLKRYKYIARLAKKENQIKDFVIYASRYFILRYKE